MSYELERKYRPRGFASFVGNEAAVSLLKSKFEANKPPHKLLITGPAGCGKTTLARIFKKQIGCSDEDFYEYDAATTRGIDTIREIREAMRYAPRKGDVKIYFLDESHELTGPAMNAILKALEEPPSYVYFILCTTEEDKMLPTIKSRCTHIRVAPLPSRDLMQLLHQVAKKEGKNVKMEVMKKIASLSRGAPRDGLKMLNAVIDMDDPSTEALVDATIDNPTVLTICRTIVARLDPPTKFKQLMDTTKDLTQDAEKVRYAILEYLRKVLISNPSDATAEKMMLFSQSFIYSKDGGLAVALYLASKI